MRLTQDADGISRLRPQGQGRDAAVPPRPVGGGRRHPTHGDHLRSQRPIVRKTGQTGVPVIKIGNRWIVGFDKEQIEKEAAR